MTIACNKSLQWNVRQPDDHQRFLYMTNNQQMILHYQHNIHYAVTVR